MANQNDKLILDKIEYYIGELEKVSNELDFKTKDFDKSYQSSNATELQKSFGKIYESMKKIEFNINNYYKSIKSKYNTIGRITEETSKEIEFVANKFEDII